jgi:hypothetical protein
MKSPIAAFIGFLVGAIVLAGYFTNSPLLASIRYPILDWTVILAGVAGLIAILNLVFGVHMKRIRDKAPRQAFSYILILSFVVVLIVGILAGPTHPVVQKTVTNIQVPVETSLMAVLAITLAYASLRFLQRQRNWMGITFFIATLFFLLINSGVFSFSADLPVLRTIVSAAHQLPVAGARGILLGIALGSLATGIRILIGADRPYNN